MIHKDLRGLLLHFVYPVKESVFVCVAADACKGFYPCIHRDLIPVDLHTFCPVKYPSAQGPLSLIPYKEHRGVLLPQVVLQMMADSARLAHSAGRDHHLGALVSIELFRLFNAYVGVEPRENKGILSPFHNLFYLFIKAIQTALHIDAGGLVCKG